MMKIHPIYTDLATSHTSMGNIDEACELTGTRGLSSLGHFRFGTLGCQAGFRAMVSCADENSNTCCSALLQLQQ